MSVRPFVLALLLAVWVLLLPNLASAYTGDFNGNGTVDLDDLTRFVQQFQLFLQGQPWDHSYALAGGSTLGHSDALVLLEDYLACQAIPVTPMRASASLTVFDSAMTSFMSARHIPAGALAVSYNGRLVLATGYGWSDTVAHTQVQPTDLFRIASITKPFTATAVLRLIQDSGGAVTLDTPILSILHYTPHFQAGQTLDPRLATITIREVLQHLGGWDSSISFDPMFRSVAIAQEMGTAPPADQSAIIPYTLGYPLDHDPGTTFAYSNFGYCLLGRLLEKLSGQSYATYVQNTILTPLGITSMRLGRTLPSLRAPHEVCYYDPAMGADVMEAPYTQQVPYPYGGFCLEAMDSHGGWLSSAPDLLRFAHAFDDINNCPLLNATSTAAMFARPAVYTDPNRYYACGWSVVVAGAGKYNYWHNGSLAGTWTYIVRCNDGIDWAVLFDQRVDPSNLSYSDIDSMLWTARNSVTSWPTWDLWNP